MGLGEVEIQKCECTEGGCGCGAHNVSINIGDGSGGLGDAPADGNIHGRKDGAWTRIPNVAPLLFYRGAKASPETLKEEHPADVPGAYAVVLSTHTVWIWDKGWVDTGETTTNAGIVDAPSDGKTYGRKDAAWVEAGGGGIGDPKDIEHNSVSGIQGGRVEDGRVVEAYHLSREEYEKLPHRPTILSPENGATNINQVPQVIGSAYLHPWDVPMWGKHIQIATDVGFATVVYELEGYSGSPVFQVPLKPDNTPYLTQDTEYFARIRYQDVKGRWSHWSAGSRFKTMVAFPAGLLLTPVMLIPSDGMALPRYNPVLAMSSPKVAAGVANFDKADWQISSDRTFATTLYSATDTPDLAVHRAQGLNLTTVVGTDFFARGRQKTVTGEATPWAVPARFSLLPEYDNPVFGFRRVFSKLHKQPFVSNIDLDGNEVYIPKSYWDKHPLYAFARQDIVLGKDSGGVNVVSEMAFVPPVWEKCNVYDNADGDMVIDLWFSATPKSGDGWFLDPAFAKSPNGFLHGVALTSTASSITISPGVTASSVPISKTGVTGVGMTMSSLRTLKEKFNIAWHSWTIYERRLLLDLMAAEHASLKANRVSSGLGSKNILGESFFWRGFLGLVNISDSQTTPSAQRAIILDGLEWSSLENVITEVRVKTPSLDNTIGFALSLPWGTHDSLGTFCVTNIERGFIPLLGFDVALLGVAKTAEDNANGNKKCVWGMRDKIAISAITGDNRWGIRPDDMGLFGMAPSYGASGYFHSRLSLWLP